MYPKKCNLKTRILNELPSQTNYFKNFYIPENEWYKFDITFMKYNTFNR